MTTGAQPSAQEGTSRFVVSQDDLIAFVRGSVQPAWAHERMILLCQSGSQAYGTATNASDYDLRGVTIPPRPYFTGFLHHFEQAQAKGVCRQRADERDVDVSLYDLRKFCKLAADCNPNVIELLFVDEADVLFAAPAGRALRDARSLFVSTKAQHTFSGYAMAQLKRIRTHRKWLLDPPSGQPSRAAYGLPEETILSADILGAIDALQAAAARAEGEVARVSIPAHVMEIYRQERSYQNARREWQQYQGWKRDRNPARAETEARFGYDTKHAMHLVRLMRMGAELLATGTFAVRRPDADELTAIRNGAWSYDALIAWAEDADTRMRALAASSPLPKRPNRNAIDRLCRDIVAREVMTEPESDLDDTVPA